MVQEECAPYAFPVKSKNKITILFLIHSYSIIDLESGDSTSGAGIAAGIHLHTSSNKKSGW